MEKKKEKVKMIRNILGGAAFAAGIIGIIAGIANGESALVLQKAIRICLECIGIG